METKRKALGKGLEQLFSNEVINFENFEKDIVKGTPKSEILEIKLSDIRSNPYQPRKTFDEESLKEFSESQKYIFSRIAFNKISSVLLDFNTFSNAKNL